MTSRLTGAIQLPDGTYIRGRGRREGLPGGPLPEFGLYLGRSRGLPRRASARRAVEQEPAWAAAWLDWPDFRTPRDPRAAAVAIRQAYALARAGQRVEVACGGGTGRTGTVLACMAILAGHPATDAVAWTRRHYRPRAVETPGQRRWVGWFAALEGDEGQSDEGQS
ncbi:MULTISPECIES: protein-tyrosine phosphatase family protein [Pseudofrankia]|uniref:protein-tyrosine phosphatase family protein n=1 Tax=Pseudofrankia TaxID=2994363 RepID=UPI00031E6416|nr:MULTISPECIES: protein-tyrosine phosphatase family protein [Pseudofrankia]OHV36615.1 phosphatase [Pseudofrankia sp. EUN1h]